MLETSKRDEWEDIESKRKEELGSDTCLRSSEPREKLECTKKVCVLQVFDRRPIYGASLDYSTAAAFVRIMRLGRHFRDLGLDPRPVAIASTLERVFPTNCTRGLRTALILEVVDGFTANENAGTGSREYRAEAENQFENFEDAGTLARLFLLSSLEGPKVTTSGPEHVQRSVRVEPRKVACGGAFPTRCN